MTKREVSDAIFAAAERVGLDVAMVRFDRDTQMVGVYAAGLNDWTRFDREVFEACEDDKAALGELIAYELIAMLPRLRPEHE